MTSFDKYSSRIAVTAFFSVYLLIGLLCYNDYGIPWDDGMDRASGLVTTKYILQKFWPAAVENEPAFASVPDLHSWVDKDYGVAIHVPLLVAERLILGAEASLRDQSMLRHLLMFLIFFVGVVFFYKLVVYRFGDWRWGLLGCTMLILSPRIFADSFYNTKDIALLAAFIVATFYLVRYLETNSIKDAVWFAVATAIAINIRVLAIILPLTAIAFLMWDLIWDRKNMRQRLLAWRSLGIYLLLTAVIMFAGWPYLWSNPIENFAAVFGNMSKFRWPWSVLYMGETVAGSKLPWHYPFVWIAITTPLSYTFLFLVGLVGIIYVAVKNGFCLYTTSTERQDFVFVALSIIPVIAIVMLNAILYDGWRQLFFIYGAFLMIALVGLQRVITILTNLRNETAQKCSLAVVALVIAINVVTVSVIMIRNHPYQNVYFNALVENPQHKFELDYWGLSYRQALEYIVQHDNRDSIRIHANTRACEQNKSMLSTTDLQRLAFVDANPDYYVTNFRNHNNQMPPHYPENLEVYNVTVNKTKIVAIYHLTGAFHQGVSR